MDFMHIFGIQYYWYIFQKRTLSCFQKWMIFMGRKHWIYKGKKLNNSLTAKLNKSEKSFITLSIFMNRMFSPVLNHDPSLSWFDNICMSELPKLFLILFNNFLLNQTVLSKKKKYLLMLSWGMISLLVSMHVPMKIERSVLKYRPKYLFRFKVSIKFLTSWQCKHFTQCNKHSIFLLEFSF